MSMENGNSEKKHVACSSETVDHLLIMVNGILGRVTDWKFAASEFVKNPTHSNLLVHCSSTNVGIQTMDGVDVMGERLADEIKDLTQLNPNLAKISIIAHSVGGLVARYAIGRLYTPTAATICGLEPINFITVATPHLGSRGHNQVPFLFGLPCLEKTANVVIHLIFRRTGRHLFLNDNDHGKPPLLRRLLQDDDVDQYYFMSALRAFKRRVIYSNVAYDNIVGWRTSSIRRNCELPKWEDCVSEKYPHVVHEEVYKAFDVEQSEPVTTDGEDADKIEEDLIIGLSRVSWEKIDVSFHTSKQRSDAHSIIQVKDQTVHSEGADVIQHMIDHFHF